MYTSLVSVIMPAYNASKVIEESIYSVLNQTYKNIELIVIEDCSTDNTKEILGKYEHIENILILYNKKNSGVSESRNIGLSLAKGKYIAFLDSDDIWNLDKINIQINHINQLGSDFIFTGVNYINDYGGKYNYKYIPKEKTCYNKLLKQNTIACSSVLVKAEYLKKRSFRYDYLHEDFLLWLKILKEEEIIAYCIQDSLLTYRLSTGGKSGDKTKSFKMTYGVYRKLNINRFISFYYTLNHLIRSALKHYKIRNTK